MVPIAHLPQDVDQGGVGTGRSSEIGGTADSSNRCAFELACLELGETEKWTRMAGRPGLFGGPRQSDMPDDGFGRDVLGGFGRPDPAWPDRDPNALPPGFDPVWGTLGAPAQSVDPWRADSEQTLDGPILDVEVYGDGFQISGQIGTGQFPRLSDWLNMQNGFVPIHDARHVHLGHQEMPEGTRGTLWVRLDQIVLVAERANTQQTRLGAPVVQKQRRQVSIVTPGYNLRGSLHVVASGSMRQFLETPDPHFIPITDLTVHWLECPELVAHFPFAVINREQLVTVLDEPQSPESGAESDGGAGTSADDMPLHRRFGAA